MEISCKTNEQNRSRVIEILTASGRDGIDKLLAWLDKSDYYEAPASTKYHLSCDGGLLQHSLNVYDQLMKLAPLYMDEDEMSKYEKSFGIVALLHDLCKCNFYEKYKRNVKNDETGRWEQVDAYRINEKLPMGHSTKSVFIIQQFIHLSVEEYAAILAHMGGWDSSVKGGDQYVGSLLEKYKLAALLHAADLLSSKIIEVNQ